MSIPLQFPRQIGLKRIVCRDKSEWDSYIGGLGRLGLSSIYTSLYAFDEMDGRKPVYDSAIMDRAWWDFDTTEEYSLENVKSDVAILLKRLKGDVRLVFTGRGFHIHQLFREPVRGREWAHRLDRYEKMMALGLKSLDGVGYPEKLCRIPDTYNPKRNRWCITISAEEFMDNPHGYKIPNKPSPSEHTLNAFTGNQRDVSHFSLIEWIRDNPEPKRASIRPQNTVSVGITPTASSVPLPACLDRAIRVSNPPHHVRVALVQFMANHLRLFADPNDISQEETKEIIDEICAFISSLAWLDYNPNITRKAVESLIRYVRVPSPAWFRKNNLCNGRDCWYCG